MNRRSRGKIDADLARKEPTYMNADSFTKRLKEALSHYRTVAWAMRRHF